MAQNGAATQEFVGIKDIKDSVVIEPNGKMVSILLQVATMKLFWTNFQKHLIQVCLIWS